jgi:hypothetical protein
MYKVLVCGDRNWVNPIPIERELRKLIRRHGANNLIIIEGKAPGADQLAGFWARSLNIHVVEVQALWDTRYRSAGPQRNDVMLALGPDEVVAFHQHLPKSKGTKDMVKKSRNAGVKTRVVKK